MARALGVAALLFGVGCRTEGRSPPRARAPAGSRPAAPEECQEVITPSSAQQIFRQLTGLRAGDRCVMNGLTTRQSVMRVAWTRDGAPLPELVITPAVCAPSAAEHDGRYVIERGGAFAAACPETLAALRRTFAHDAPAPTLARRVGSGAGSPRAWAKRGLLLMVLAALAVAGWRRRRTRETDV